MKNPLEALAQIIAAFKDAHGRIAVPGFYDGVRELSPHERAEIGALPFDPAKEAHGLGVPELAGENTRLPLERMWFRPTLEVNGMYGGYQGAGQKTIIPSFAKAKVSARLVPHQDPEHVKHAFTTFVQRVAPKGVTVEVEAHGDTRAVETSRDHPAVAAAARAMELGFGNRAGVHRDRRHDRPGVLVRPHPAPAAGADRRRTARRRDPRAQREIRPRPVLPRHRDDDVPLRRARDVVARGAAARG